jgi:hypothetical protein
MARPKHVTKSGPLTLAPLDFSSAVDGLLRVKPTKKAAKKAAPKKLAKKKTMG